MGKDEGTPQKRERKEQSTLHIKNLHNGRNLGESISIKNRGEQLFHEDSNGRGYCQYVVYPYVRL
jgi:hypothetical protein